MPLLVIWNFTKSSTEGQVESRNIFGERLKEMRKKRGLRQNELAERANLQPTAISHFENGARLPSFDNLRRLADALEVTVDYLMGRVDEPEVNYSVSASLARDIGILTAAEGDVARYVVASLASRRRGKKRSKP